MTEWGKLSGKHTGELSHHVHVPSLALESAASNLALGYNLCSWISKPIQSKGNGDATLIRSQNSGSGL